MGKFVVGSKIYASDPNHSYPPGVDFGSTAIVSKTHYDSSSGSPHFYYLVIFINGAADEFYGIDDYWDFESNKSATTFTPTKIVPLIYNNDPYPEHTVVVPETQTKARRCECGAHAVGGEEEGVHHAKWCPQWRKY